MCKAEAVDKKAAGALRRLSGIQAGEALPAAIVPHRLTEAGRREIPAVTGINDEAFSSERY